MCADSGRAQSLYNAEWHNSVTVCTWLSDFSCYILAKCNTPKYIHNLHVNFLLALFNSLRDSLNRKVRVQNLHAILYSNYTQCIVKWIHTMWDHLIVISKCSIYENVVEKGKPCAIGLTLPSRARQNEIMSRVCVCMCDLFLFLFWLSIMDCSRYWTHWMHTRVGSTFMLSMFQPVKHAHVPFKIIHIAPFYLFSLAIFMDD